MFSESPADTGSDEKCYICIVIITTASAPGCIYILMFYSEPPSNVPLNYTVPETMAGPGTPKFIYPQ